MSTDLPDRPRLHGGYHAIASQPSSRWRAIPPGARPPLLNELQCGRGRSGLRHHHPTRPGGHASFPGGRRSAGRGPALADRRCPTCHPWKFGEIPGRCAECQENGAYGAFRRPKAPFCRAPGRLCSIATRSSARPYVQGDAAAARGVWTAKSTVRRHFSRAGARNDIYRTV